MEVVTEQEMKECNDGAIQAYKCIREICMTIVQNETQKNAFAKGKIFALLAVEDFARKEIEDIVIGN